jgi:hypothetical protein
LYHDSQITSLKGINFENIEQLRSLVNTPTQAVVHVNEMKFEIDINYLIIE